MEDSTVVKGVFFDTKKLDSELMVRCLQAILNNLPNFQFTSIIIDEKFLGYRVHFSSPGEEAVLENQLMVSGQSIRICPLKTFLSIQILNKTIEVLSKSEIEEAIGDQFGKLIDISPISESGTYRNENVQVFADIPEIKAQEKFQESRHIFLTLPNKKSKLRVTLRCMLCKKDGHVVRDCNQVGAVVGRQTSSDGESVFADSTMKMDINIESTEEYAEKIGREEVMKTEYFSDSLVDNKCTTEKKKFKKGPNIHSSAGVSGQNPTTISNNSKHSPSKSNADEDEDEDEDIQILSHQIYPGATPFRFEVKNEPASTDEESNPLPEHTSFTSSPGPSSVKRRRSQAAPTVVEDMNVLSESLQECINSACENFEILSREELQAFFHHVKKKSNVVEVALKYLPDVVRLKELLQHISKSYYNTTQTGTKEDKRFIKWLDERIGKFDRKVPQKRKRTTPDQD